MEPLNWTQVILGSGAKQKGTGTYSLESIFVQHDAGDIDGDVPPLLWRVGAVNLAKGRHGGRVVRVRGSQSQWAQRASKDVPARPMVLRTRPRRANVRAVHVGESTRACIFDIQYDSTGQGLANLMRIYPDSKPRVSKAAPMEPA